MTQPSGPGDWQKTRPWAAGAGLGSLETWSRISQELVQELELLLVSINQCRLDEAAAAVTLNSPADTVEAPPLGP